MYLVAICSKLYLPPSAWLFKIFCGINKTTIQLGNQFYVYNKYRNEKLLLFNKQTKKNYAYKC